MDENRKLSTASQAPGPAPAVSVDRVAFLLLRVKRAFKKRRLQKKQAVTTAGKSTQTQEEITSIEQQLRNPYFVINNQEWIGDSDANENAPQSLARSHTFPRAISPKENRQWSIVPDATNTSDCFLNTFTIGNTLRPCSDTESHRSSLSIEPPQLSISSSISSIHYKKSLETIHRFGNVKQRFRRANSVESFLETDSLMCPTNVKDAHSFDRRLDNFKSDRHIVYRPTTVLQLQRYQQISALFAAVEHGHLEKAQTILDSTDVDVNSLNSDGLSSLDIALLSNSKSLAKMLLSYGAKEGGKFSTLEKLAAHLKHQLANVEVLLQESCVAPTNTAANLTPAAATVRASYPNIKDTTYHHHSPTLKSEDNDDNHNRDQLLISLERRGKMLKRLLLGYTQIRPPDIPILFTVDVTGPETVTFRLQEPSTFMDLPVTTKFKVQWSTSETFNVISGEKNVSYLARHTCTVQLHAGHRYWFRAACGNICGYGAFASSSPQSVVPSSWYDVDAKKTRFSEQLLLQLNTLTVEVRQLQALSTTVAGTTEYSSGTTEGGGTTAMTGGGLLATSTTVATSTAPSTDGKRKKASIKQLFSAASRFQKSLKRGIYLASILYNEDKVLVINEDFAPVIAIDDTIPTTNLHAELYWLMKISYCWPHIKQLKATLERITSSSTTQFRIKILQAIVQMQAALNVQNLGRFYHQPLKDYASLPGVVILSTVNHVRNPRTVSVLNSRWLPTGKLFKKHTDGLMTSIHEQINYHQASNTQLTRGLYLTYLKMQSSMELIQVVVPKKSPNMLPHCRVRENPHVSAEEWNSLKTSLSSSISINSDVERNFFELMASAARRLFNYMEIDTVEDRHHRLYNTEVMEISPMVSYLVLCPSADRFCVVPGQRELLLQRDDLLSLPIQMFELLHLNTYHPQITGQYCRLSCVLDMDLAMAQHELREAFSTEELNAAKERLQRLEVAHQRLSDIWRQCRCLVEVISFARDRQSDGLPTGCFVTDDTDDVATNQLLRQMPVLVEPPSLASSPKKLATPTGAKKGRGSWPGPPKTSNLTDEFSKSEQQLNISPPSSGRASQSNEPGEPLLLMPTWCSGPKSPYSSSGSLLHEQQQQPISKVFTSTPQRTTNDDEADDGGGANSMAGIYKSMIDLTVSPLVAPPGGKCKSLVDVKEEASVSGGGGTLQVYAAYETGLALGTSLKLHVTPRTTARQVIDLVVRQLNMATVLKGKEGPIYPSDQLKQFCLVAVIGARERCLRDDFKPLQLQNPWRKGRLYVRQKHDVLAALEHSSRQPTATVI